LRIHRVLSRLLVACVIVLPLAGCAAVTFRVDPIDSEPANKRGWSRVATLPRTSDVIVTREGAPASRTFGAANESELITLNLAGPTLPRPVKRTFRDLATDRPLDLFKVSDGQTLIDGRVRIEGDSIFLDGNGVATLDRVLERTPRSSVSEVRRVHRATRRGLMWGFIAGAGLGLAITFSSCGTHWNQETSSCTNLTPLAAFVAPSYGALIGSAVGATIKTSDVVYTAR
jgi:hypothetical protein